MAKSSSPNTSEADIYMTDNSNKNITIAIKIGPAGQKATSHIKLDQDLLLQDQDGTLPAFAVGTNLNSKNKFLAAATIVTAMSDVPSLTVQYVLNGGPDGAKTISLQSGPANTGDNVLFDITVFLF